jgi:hypothetical protein
VAEAAAAPLPPGSAEVVAELERLEREARALAEPLTEERFNWQPQRGSWSVGQCLDHLTRSNRLYLDELEIALVSAREAGLERQGPPDLGRIGRWFVRQMEPTNPRKIRTSRKQTPPERTMKEATLAAFGGEQQRAIDFVRASAPYDVSSVRFRNPFAFGLRAFNLATGIEVIAAHERRHLAQAARVVAHPAFPPG